MMAVVDARKCADCAHSTLLFEGVLSVTRPRLTPFCGAYRLLQLSVPASLFYHTTPPSLPRHRRQMRYHGAHDYFSSLTGGRYDVKTDERRIGRQKAHDSGEPFSHHGLHERTALHFSLPSFISKV